MANINLRQFNDQGRDRYKEIVWEAFKAQSRLQSEDLKIIADDNFTDSSIKGVTIDKDKVFKDKYD